VAGELPEPKVVEMREPEPAAQSASAIVEPDIAAAARAPEVEKAGGAGKAGRAG
jgi:hypothetical protein